MSIAESEAASVPAVLQLIRTAPTWQVEAGEDGPEYVAIFDDVTQSLDRVIRLIEVVSTLHGVRVSIDSRQVDKVTRLWSVLLCYRESLREKDKEAYCVCRAGQVGEASGCPVLTCCARCPFICARCFQVTRERGGLPIAEQVHRIAVQAEVEWCPNLRLSSSAGEG